MFIILLFVLLNLTSMYSSIDIIKARENVNETITCNFDRRKTKLTLNHITPIPKFNKFLDNYFSDDIILWYKDDIQVIGVNSLSNDRDKYFVEQVNISVYQLVIINVQLESAGIYKCQDFTGKEEKLFQLNVMVPPSHLRLVPSVKMPITDGTLVSFNCTSERVYPNPIFKWYKNDKLIQRSIGNQTGSTLFSSSSILTLLLTPADHNHMLRCQVSNEASIQESNVEIKLDVLFKPIIKIFFNEKELTNKLCIIENSIETMHCHISSNPSIITNIEWFKNDQFILGENREQLRINFTDIENLSCRAKNKLGQTEHRINVDLLYKPKLSMIENITLNQGETLHLKCAIDANPLCHQVRWFHNNKELFTQSCKQQSIVDYVIQNIDRSHTGKYTCEVRNWLNTTLDKHHYGISRISTDVHIQYAPYILNAFNKLTIKENSNITAECIVDAYPKPQIVWFGPFGQRLNSYSKEKFINSTVISSELNLPPSYSSILGLYRCVAKNLFGQYELSIQFQRPTFPDPPTQLHTTNITHSSFTIQWQPGFNGGLDQIYHVVINHSHSEERYTNMNWIQFKDLNDKTLYSVKIRSKNKIGFSDYTAYLFVWTKESPIRPEEFPTVKYAYYHSYDDRLHYQLSSIHSLLISMDQLCLQYYNIDEVSPCMPLKSTRTMDERITINSKQTNLRLRLCLINQTDVCSKSTPISTRMQLSSHTSEFLIILIGGVLISFIVFGIITLRICIHHRKYKQKSQNGSTDTLKTNSDNCHSVVPVRVSDTNSCLYYPTNDGRTLYYNDERIGIYSIHDKKNSLCFDSGMPSTTSNNSDSVGSQALSSSDYYDRSDGEYLVNGSRLLNKMIISNMSTYSIGTGKESHINKPIHGQVSSEESEFSTSSTSQHGKKLVYEVVV